VGVKASIIADPYAALKQARQLLASDPGTAEKQARRLLEAHPGDPAALRLLGAALRKLGKADEATRAEREAVQASTRCPAHREAARAIAIGEKKRAIAILESILARDETDVVALVMLGLQFSTENEYEIAESLLRKAVEVAPEDASARMSLSEHLHRSKRSVEALAEFDQLAPDARATANALSLRASILRDLGRQEEEVAVLQQLVATEQRNENYRIRLGHAFRTLGRADEAVATYRSVLTSAPYEGTSWWSLANLKTVKFRDADIATMEKGLTQPQAHVLNRVRLHFALGKAFEDRKEIERSFHHYDAGNRLRNTSTTYRPERISGWVDQAAECYSEEFLSGSAKNACQSAEPIFVIGIQRSGSTLLEQILDSHPDIEGTAELTELPTIIREQGDIAHRRGISFNELLRKMSADELRGLGEDYLKRTSVYRLTDKPRFTDKMPNNWIYAGVIRKILPNAKIIDMRRHPLDCCFSNWKQLYGRGLEHSYSMENMGLYYADYIRLLRLVDGIQPGKIHRVIYERLVENTEGEVRRLLDYLGLPFDEAVLNFHSNERSVRTISAEQVRQPINRKGLNQYKPYEQWLGPMKAALGSALDDWDQ